MSRGRVVRATKSRAWNCCCQLKYAHCYTRQCPVGAVLVIESHHGKRQVTNVPPSLTSWLGRLHQSFACEAWILDYLDRGSFGLGYLGLGIESSVSDPGPRCPPSLDQGAGAELAKRGIPADDER